MAKASATAPPIARPVKVSTQPDLTPELLRQISRNPAFFVLRFVFTQLHRRFTGALSMQSHSFHYTEVI